MLGHFCVSGSDPCVTRREVYTRIETHRKCKVHAKWTNMDIPVGSKKMCIPVCMSKNTVELNCTCIVHGAEHAINYCIDILKVQHEHPSVMDLFTSSTSYKPVCILTNVQCLKHKTMQVLRRLVGDTSCFITFAVTCTSRDCLTDAMQSRFFHCRKESETHSTEQMRSNYADRVSSVHEDHSSSPSKKALDDLMYTLEENPCSNNVQRAMHQAADIVKRGFDTPVPLITKIARHLYTMYPHKGAYIYGTALRTGIQASHAYQGHHAVQLFIVQCFNEECCSRQQQLRLQL